MLTHKERLKEGKDPRIFTEDLKGSVNRDMGKLGQVKNEWQIVSTRLWLTNLQPSATPFRKGHCYPRGYQCGFPETGSHWAAMAGPEHAV